MTTVRRGNAPGPLTFSAYLGRSPRRVPRRLGLALAGLGWLGAGCAGFSSEEFAGDGGAPRDDGLAPVVVSMSPTDGSSGVSAETPVVVTFSEPVDATSAQAAVHISGIPDDTLEVSLDPSGTTLTVTPRRGFAYTSGTDPDLTAAERYTVTIGTALTDLEGTPMAEPFRASFHTLRRIETSVASSSSGEYYSYAVSVDGSVNVCSDATKTFPVGHTSALAISGDHFGIAAFEDALPEGVASVESAKLGALQAPALGSFYNTGVVELEEISFQSFDATVADAAVLTDLGPFTASGAVEQPSLDITAAIADGVAQGTHSFMYRLVGAGGPNNTFANFYCGGFTLDVAYLVP